MSVGSEIEEKAKALLMKLGMWWPDANSGTLRNAADAWRTFAGSVDDVRVATNKAASTLIHHNEGEGIDAFEIFWGRYAKGKDEGWLSNLAKSARKMAKALDKFADTVDDAIEKLWTQISIDAIALVGGGLLAVFTGGASEGVAAEIIAMAASLGIAVEEAVAVIAAEMLAGAVFTSVLSVTIDAAVAQPLKIALGQQKGFSLEEVNEAAKQGMIDGGIFGAGFGVLKPGVLPKSRVPLMLRPPKVPSIRPNLIEEGAACRGSKACPRVGEPIDVATGAMLMEQTDLTLPGSLPLVFERTHVSSYRGGVHFGPTWVSLLDERVQLDAEGVVFAAADGMRLVYPVPEAGAPVLPKKGARWPLEWDGEPDGVMTVTDPESGVVRTFTRAAATEEPGAVYLPLESIEDRNGARIDIERAANGVPSAVRHSGGYYVAVDTEGERVTALRLLDHAPSIYEASGGAAEAGTVVMRYGYDDAGNLTEVINSSGEPLRFTYDDEGRVTSWTDRNGTSFAYVYDPAGRVVRTEGSDGVFNGSLAYDDEARTTVYTDSLGHRTTFRHNTDGQVIEETDPLGHTTRTEWDARGHRRLSVTDPLGRATRYAYDEIGNLTTVTLPDGGEARATYNELCRPVEVTEPGGTTWRHAYDQAGNLLATIDPAGATTRYAYDDHGHLTEVTEALGHTTRITCDAAGLPIAVVDPLGHATTAHRDIFGRVVEATDPLGHSVHMGWTMEGKPAWREEADGRRESWTWDGEGNLRSHTDPAGHTTHHTFTHFDVPATRTDPDGATYAFAYDTEVRLTEVTNPQGLTWTYTYDPAGRLTAETDFNGRTLTYTHDAAGNLLTRTNGADETLHFTRDALGRTVEQRTDAGEVTTFAYNPMGQLTRAANPDAELSIERDALGRVLSEKVNGRTTRYAYDAAGRRVRRTTPSGIVSEWTYDEAGRPTDVDNGAGSLSFTYDAAGRETERRLGEGVTLAQTWDKADRLTTQTLTGGAGAADRLLQHRSYAYRVDGYLTEIRELTSGTRRFDLDPVGRVTAVHAHGWTETYAYDTLGNLTHATAPAHESPGDREFAGTIIHRAGRTTYEHDTQGRLTRRTRKLLNGQTRTWTFTWNAEDRLTEAVNPEGEHWRYTYDPLGRRISKQRLAEDSTVAETVAFTWDDTRLAEQTTHADRVTTWEYAPGTHRPLSQTDRTALSREPGASLVEKFTGVDDVELHTRFHAIVTDLVGTPTELVSPDGELAWQHRTSLWGMDFPSSIGPDAAHCPLRFPGQYADLETGLYYNYFRHYDPETARYTTPDPLGLAPAPNHHAYVIDPRVWMDVLGLAGCKDIRVSAVDSDWATKGAHLHLGKDEVRVFPTGDGKIGAEGIRMSTGMASERSVKRVLDAVHSSPELREDLIAKARSAREHMNDHNWGNEQNKAAEMHFLIKALEKM